MNKTIKNIGSNAPAGPYYQIPSLEAFLGVLVYITI